MRVISQVVQQIIQTCAPTMIRGDARRDLDAGRASVLTTYTKVSEVQDIHHIVYTMLKILAMLLLAACRITTAKSYNTSKGGRSHGFIICPVELTSNLWYQ